MNITPVSIVKNRFQRTAFLAGAIAIAGHAMVQNPVEEKRKEIIATMNQVLQEESIDLARDNKCNIVIQGKKQGLLAILVCNSTLISTKEFPDHIGSDFITQVDEIDVTSNNKLKENSGCMIIEEGGYIVMDPPNCGSEKKDRIIL